MNVNKNETKHKATHKLTTTTQCKEIDIQTFVHIVTHVQMSRKNVREYCFIKIVPFC